ncbi:hypothetical protein QFC20_004037 [Naganishia adeliensis]|uniref:Uncharacterized protein n=1 Tax=Naganishia adeliensis TaxID=92952 RepID=A0ACC2W609_9TREE|nr:hypothetical protein QFC20_004037 [Naganishia adeliensis]
MLNDKHGPIGKALQGIPPAYREASFMGGQLGTQRLYSIICMLPAATFLIYSPKACFVFLILVWSQAVWNGASFYVEVFGRKFERELEKLRKEINTASSTPNSANAPSTAPSQASSPSFKGTADVTEQDSSAGPSTGNSQQTQLNTLANAGLKPALGLSNSPLTLGPTDMSEAAGKEGRSGQVEQLDLDGSARTSLDVGESRKDR